MIYIPRRQFSWFATFCRLISKPETPDVRTRIAKFLAVSCKSRFSSNAQVLSTHLVLVLLSTAQRKIQFSQKVWHCKRERFYCKVFEMRVSNLPLRLLISALSAPGLIPLNERMMFSFVRSIACVKWRRWPAKNPQLLGAPFVENVIFSSVEEFRSTNWTLCGTARKGSNLDHRFSWRLLIRQLH